LELARITWIAKAATIKYDSVTQTSWRGGGEILDEVGSIYLHLALRG
jgi:hypothetical protein